MHNVMQWSGAVLAMYLALAVAMSPTAVALTVDTRLVVPGGSATTSKILPGQSVMFEVRIDAPDKSTIGAAYRLMQTSPVIVPPNFFFAVTGRSIAGSPYNASSGVSDATATASPGNRLDPANDQNLGKNTVGLAGIQPATNILATTITLSSDAATPLGTYRIQPTVLSFVTEITTRPPFGTDWPMNAAFFDVVVGQTLMVTKSGTGTGTVTANSGAINCGATCSDIYPGTTVTLTAAPAGGSTFAGWSGGDCTGTGACVVTVSAATTVNAAFNLAPPPTNIPTLSERMLALLALMLGGFALRAYRQRV